MARPASKLSSRLACADSGFPRLSHDAALAVIADLGLRAVDICVFPVAHTHPDVVRSDPAAAAKNVRARVERHGLTVSDVFLIPGRESLQEYAVNHPDAEIRAHSFAYFESTATFARLVGSPGLTVLPGMPFDDAGASFDLAAHELARRAERARDLGLALSIEPHYDSIVQTPARTLELLERVPEIQLALDYSHFVYQGIPQTDVEVLISHARHIHLRQAGPGAMQLPAHSGVLDFPLMVARLDAAGYSGFLCLEYQWEEWLGCNRVDCISETAELRDLLLASGVAETGTTIAEVLPR
jgi:sugar phosphate isomerase/epimerase